MYKALQREWQPLLLWCEAKHMKQKKQVCNFPHTNLSLNNFSLPVSQYRIQLAFTSNTLNDPVLVYTDFTSTTAHKCLTKLLIG